MTMTDPIADMLTRIRNANVAMHDNVRMPSSKLKESLAAVLVSEGYIEGFEVSRPAGRPGRVLDITMKYTKDRTGRSPGCGGSPSPACGSTPQPTSCPGCSAGSASQCCRPARGS